MSHDVFGFGTIAGGITQSGNNLLDINDNIIAIINMTDNAGQLKITFSNAAGDAVTQDMVTNIVKAVTFSTTDTSINNGSLLNLNYVFNDGISGVNSVTSVSPVVINYNSPTENITSAESTYTEGSSSPVTIASNVIISDAALQTLNNGFGNYSGSSITISRTDGINSYDLFGFGTIASGITHSGNHLLDSTGTIIASINTTDNPGQLKITFSDAAGDAVTQFMVNSIVKAVIFKTTDITITNGDMISLNYTFNDGISGVGSVTSANQVAVHYTSPTENIISALSLP